MAKIESFDVTTGVDLQEVDNAINQARKEIAQRFDFKGVLAEIEFNRAENQLVLRAQDKSKLEAMWELLATKMVRRGVSVKNMHRGNVEPASGDSVRQEVAMQQGLDTEVAKAIVRAIKDAKLKKVQAAIQGDTVRISGPSRDELQGVIAMLKKGDYGVELKFENYR